MLHSTKKGWSKHQNIDNIAPNKVGVAFMNVGDDEQQGKEGNASTTKGEKYKNPACEKCGSDAKHHAEGTLLHIEPVKVDVVDDDNEVSACHNQHVFTTMNISLEMPTFMLLNDDDILKLLTCHNCGFC